MDFLFSLWLYKNLEQCPANRDNTSQDKRKRHLWQEKKCCKFLSLFSGLFKMFYSDSSLQGERESLL